MTSVRTPLRGIAGAAVAVLSVAAVTALASPVAAQPRSPIIQNQVVLNPAQPVGFDVLVWPDSVYVGQQATYEMGVFISESAQRRMRRNPEVVPAELRGVLAYDLGGPQSLPAITQNGIRSFPHILQRALFPLADGQVTIPASQLSYSLPRTSSYFSREEAAGVRAGALSLHVKSLPRAGQPDDFSGAVGVLSLGAQLDVAQVRIGDPVVLTLRVDGRGNVKLWPRPTLQTPSAALVEAGVRVRVDSTGQYIRGTKEFDWLVTPEREGRITIPVVDYPYFDPYAEEYRVASSDSLTIAVAGGTVTPRFAGDGSEIILALRREDRGPLAIPLVERPVLWAVLALLPFPAWMVRRRRIRRGRAVAGGATAAAVAWSDVEATDRGPAGALASVADGHGDPLRIAAASLRRRFLAELARDLDSSSAELVEGVALQRRLRRRGVTRETTSGVMQLLADLDTAAWSPPGSRTGTRDAGAGAPAGTPQASWTDRHAALLAAVRREAMAVPGSPRRVPPLNSIVLLVMGSMAWFGLVGTLQARDADFLEAVARYDAGDFVQAAAAFTAIGARAPRHADAWANAGTAAWAAEDTVGAVIGWQRALRLEPAAADVRGRLALTGVAAESGIAPVSSMPRTAVAWAAVLLWSLAWLAFAWHLGPVSVRLALVVAGAAAVAAGWQARRLGALDDSALAVVTSRQSLRDQPAPGATPGSPANTGALVQRSEERTAGSNGEVWVAVRLDAEHAGWLPASELQPLFRP